MSALLERPASVPPPAPDSTPRRLTRPPLDRRSLVWPALAAALNALAFYLVAPNVGDLQAALARQSAASNGVGLTYWFTWFGGGSTPGNYSVISPYLSALIGALGVGALATIAITPLAWAALAGLPHRVPATWVATTAAVFNLWSGRVPFSLGCAVALVSVIGVRRRIWWLAVPGAIGASLSSPVTGAFLGAGLLASFLVDRDQRRWTFGVGAACGVALVGIAVIFGAPGPQTFSTTGAFFVAFAAVFLLIARPAQWLRTLLWMTAIIAPFIAIFPNGLGSNLTRLPWLCLPAAVVATATASRRRVILAVLPAAIMVANQTANDLYNAAQPQASSRYYDSIISQLQRAPDTWNHRLEVVVDPSIHTAAYALLDHAMLAGGYETQEQNHLNGILADTKRLNAITYHIWLEDNSVGYVAFDVGAKSDAPEYKLVAKGRLPYLKKVSGDSQWTLYRVLDATPIVPSPQRLVAAGQAQLQVYSPCACRFAVRVRWSKYLEAKTAASDSVPSLAARVEDDGTGWTVLTTPAAGLYLLG